MCQRFLVFWYNIYDILKEEVEIYIYYCQSNVLPWLIIVKVIDFITKTIIWHFQRIK